MMEYYTTTKWYKFTIRDRDNDQWSSGNCTVDYEDNEFMGGCWHNACYHIRPNHGYNDKYTIIVLNGHSHSLPLIYRNQD